MPPPVDALRIQGLRRLRRDLAALDKDFRRGLDRALADAVQPIVRAAKQRYRRLYPRRRRSRGSQRAIRGLAGGGRVRVLLGSPRYDYLLGQEWGSRRYPQFPAPTDRGRFFWPAVVAGRDDAVAQVERAVDGAVTRHFAD